MMYPVSTKKPLPEMQIPIHISLSLSQKNSDNSTTASAVLAPESPNSASTERKQTETPRTNESELLLPGPDMYWSAKDLDVRAVPIGVYSGPKTSRNMQLGRMVTVRARLFINEMGVVDRYELIEAELQSDLPMEIDFGGMLFKPAQKDGVAVKSQKVIEISYLQPD